MAITPTKPIVEPEKTYTKYWMQRFEIIASHPLKDAIANITLVPYNETKDGKSVVDVQMGYQNEVRFQIYNLFELAATDVEIAQIIGLLLNKVDKVAKQKALI
jgi:hypothetical protein